MCTICSVMFKSWEKIFFPPDFRLFLFLTTNSTFTKPKNKRIMCKEKQWEHTFNIIFPHFLWLLFLFVHRKFDAIIRNRPFFSVSIRQWIDDKKKNWRNQSKWEKEERKKITTIEETCHHHFTHLIRSSYQRIEPFPFDTLTHLLTHSQSYRFAIYNLLVKCAHVRMHTSYFFFD